MNDSYAFPRVQALPELQRASLRIDGVEKVGYEFGRDAPRPFFYPILGPSGATLTRLEQPSPSSHEHHRSAWFGHQQVNGIDFWEEIPGTDIQLRHRGTAVHHDGPDWAGLVAEIDWWARGQVQMRQRLTIALEPQDSGYALDLQSRFEAAGGPVELGRTNFGFLGVRVARTMSEQYGGGRLTSSTGDRGEPAISGHIARWVDYSGPSGPGTIEGIAYFDHPENPGHPAHWQARRDGWMAAAFNLASSWGLAAGHPLDLRYRLLIHSGPDDRDALDRAWERYAATPAYTETVLRTQHLAGLQRIAPVG